MIRHPQALQATLVAALTVALSACTGMEPRSQAPASPPRQASVDTRPPLQASPPDHATPVPAPASPEPAQPSATRNGLQIYTDFRDGLAEPECGNADPRWLRHFAHAPARLANADSDALPLFGHVVDMLREAQLPTEFALIPFIESGYAPAARSSSGPAGMWQFVAPTARHHGIAVGKSYDGRLSPAESTRAAVRYLETLNDTFSGNWRLAAMAYNAGEYRIRQALRRNGDDAADTTPRSVPGLSATTYAYVEKLHALACLLEDAGERETWRAALDRPVPNLHAQPLEGARSLEHWASANGVDAGLLRRLNPALANHWPGGKPPLALAPPTALDPSGTSIVAGNGQSTTPDDDPAVAPGRTHTVRRGDSAWAIARRYGLSATRLLERNGLGAKSVLRPGTVLQLD